MSSGEADAYTYTIKNNSLWPNDYNWTVPANNTVTWSTSYPIYYYQITCPKCNTLGWAEVDKVVTCKGETQARNNRKVPCGAKIKAVLEQVDYEIPVVKP